MAHLCLGCAVVHTGKAGSSGNQSLGNKGVCGGLQSSSLSTDSDDLEQIHRGHPDREELRSGVFHVPQDCLCSDGLITELLLSRPATVVCASAQVGAAGSMEDFAERWHSAPVSITTGTQPCEVAVFGGASRGAKDLQSVRVYIFYRSRERTLTGWNVGRLARLREIPRSRIGSE
jgi:hypothetical protein